MSLMAKDSRFGGSGALEKSRIARHMTRASAEAICDGFQATCGELRPGPSDGQGGQTPSDKGAP